MCLFLILIFISPIISVLYITHLANSSLSIISLLGCPNLLSSPTPINAILGFTAFKNSFVVEPFEPMMCNL